MSKCRFILGDGHLLDSLQELVAQLNLKGVVEFRGFVQNPYPILKNCDLFVLSSNWEGLPTVIIEALALGTPVVATDCDSGPAEILESGKWGKLAPVGDWVGLGDKIIEGLSEPKPSKEGLQQRAAMYDQDSVFAQYKNLVLSSVSRNSNK